MSMQEIKDALHDHEARLQEKYGSHEQRMTLLEDQMVSLEQKGLKQAPAGGHEPSSVGNILAQQDGYKAFMDGAKNSGAIDLGIEVKTLTSLQGATGSPATGVDVLPEYQGGLFGYGQRRLTLIDALPSRPIATNALAFTKLNNFTNAAAVQAGEGTAKAEQTLDPINASAPVVTIAAHTSLSKQVVEDEMSLQLAVNQLMRYSVLEKAEDQLINGDGTGFNMTGLLSEGTAFVPTYNPKADRIGEAASSLSSTGYEPSLVILHPTDWFGIRAERASTAEYVAGGWATGAPANIFGVPVVVSPAVASGTAIVLDAAFVQLLDRQSATVELSREHGSNFTSNIVTVLAELRAGLAVYDGAAVLSIDLNAAV